MDVSSLIEVVIKTEDGDEEEISSKNEYDNNKKESVTSACTMKKDLYSEGSDEDEDNNEEECDRPFAVTLPYIKAEQALEEEGAELKAHEIVSHGESASDEDNVEGEIHIVTPAVKRSHLRKGVSKDLPLSHSCTICKMVFPQERMLRDHRCGLPTDPKFGCDECGRAFPQSSMLKRHWYLHHKERKLACLCDTCGKSFLDPSHLKTHQRTHTGLSALLFLSISL
ncbi:hypothetical protein R5R35_009938 [Gryllus longicercus]|uniref:C2H2-type domain-containing protein n=1 Tax=Gryllus longicercus TaxID=2509291 RepID=A0AAN9YTV8_9ORTH